MKILNLIYTKLCIFLFVSNIFGNINSDTTWSGVVTINEDIIINNNTTLTIESGTLIQFAGSFKILVNGSIKAIGAIEDTITFTATTGANWKGIHFNQISAQNDSSILIFCKLEKGKTVTSGSGEQGGGVLFIKNSSKVRIDNCLIQDNSSNFYGGAIFVYNANPIFKNNIFKNNSAGYGGAIACREYSSPIIRDNQFIGNSANIDIDLGNGGAINLYEYCSGIIVNNNFKGNSAGFGGAISLYSSSPEISGNEIANNIALHYGGGVFIRWYSNPILKNNILNENHSYKGGGGITIWYNRASVNINRNTISNNIAEYNGGGIFIYDESSLKIKNCLIFNNLAHREGGAIYCLDGNAYIENTTIVDNEAIISVGGCYCDNQSAQTILNSIIWNNSGSQIYGASNITFTDIMNGFEGEGNIQIDPGFVDTLSNNYHLRTTSPCIDAGNPNSSFDFEPSYNGKRINMGSYGNTEEATISNPEIDVSITELNFDSLLIQKTDTLAFFIYNSGITRLNMDSIYIASYEGFQIIGDSINSLTASDSFGISIIFMPLKNKDYTTNVTIQSNDEDESILIIPITAFGHLKPLPILLDTIPDFTINEDSGEHLFIDNLCDYFYDRDSLDLIFNVSVNNQGVLAQIVDTSLFITTIQDSFGIFPIFISATDYHSQSIFDTVNIIINPINDIPKITFPDTITFTNNDTFSLNIWKYVQDVEQHDSLLIYSFNFDDSYLNYEYDENKGDLVIKYIPNYVGYSYFNIIVEDNCNALVFDSLLVIIKASTIRFEDFNPDKPFLFQNYPNPFNIGTNISFYLPTTEKTSLIIYNNLGQRIFVEKEIKSKGFNNIYFYDSNISSGFYYYQLSNEKSSIIKKMIFIK